jgi:gamma-glutamyl:cysteine ligase YbdK (ATP-grasp superfamily)
MAIEIRTADTQECPRADLALAELVVATVRSLVEQRHSDTLAQQRVDTELLARFHQDSVERAGAATWPTREYLALFGIDRDRLSVRETWAFLADELLPRDRSTTARDAALAVVLEEGTLAERIAAALSRAPGPAPQRAVYHRLAACLADGSSFHAHEH